MDLSLKDLHHIINNADYTYTLATALGSSDSAKRKQVIQLLSALCVYNKEIGYKRTLETLDHFKVNQNMRYRLAFIVEELRDCSINDCNDERSEYSACLVALINCLIVCAPGIYERVAIRNQLLGLRLYDVIELIRLRREYGHFSSDMTIQLETFEAQRYTDEGQLNGPDGVDLNSHLEVFYAILRQVSLTPQQVPFLTILQNLLRIDYTQPIADVIWKTASALVEKSILIEDEKDAARLVLKCRCGERTPRGIGSPRVLSPQPATIPKTSASQVPPSAAGSPPPPPPPPPSQELCFCPGPPPPPPPPLVPTKASKPNSVAVAPAQLLPQQWTPKPKSKMKTLNWCKIPAGRVLNGKNLWSCVAKSHGGPTESLLDFESIEELFCQQPSTPSMHRKANARKIQEITLLDGKRSLNISIFLKQFRSCDQDIAHMIRKGLHQDIGAERLRGLLKILPEPEEVDLLKNYEGDAGKLGLAEQFLLDLIHITEYKLRIECLLLKEDYAANMGVLEPSIRCIRCAATAIEEASKLHEVLYMILVAGNFLNSGGYAGNAAGFRMMSLLKVTDMRANRPGMSLIHYVAMESERKGTLDFVDQLKPLEEASRLSIDNLRADAAMLDQRVSAVNNMVLKAQQDLRNQMQDFIINAVQRVQTIKDQLDSLEGVRTKLALFLCEELETFKLEECFKVFWNFCLKFRTAVEENEKRVDQEKKAEMRRRFREEQGKRLSVEFSGSESDVMDMLLGDIKSGFPQLFSKVRRIRRTDNNSEDDTVSLGLANSPRLTRRSNFGSSLASMADNESPDVTPTGSLKKRRNRSSSEIDDNNLLDYLKQTELAQQQHWQRRSSRRIKPENTDNPNLETLHERPKVFDEETNKKSPEPKSPTTQEAKVSPPTEPKRDERTTNVVRPLVQSAQEAPECLTLYTSRPMSTLRPPNIDDTDTSTGGESPVLMRRRAYHSMKDVPSRLRHSLPIRAGNAEVSILPFRSSRSTIAGLDEGRRSVRQRSKHETKKKKEDCDTGLQQGNNNDDDDFDSESSFDRFSPVRRTTRKMSTRSLLYIPTQEKTPTALIPPASTSKDDILDQTDSRKEDKSLRARLARKIHSLTDNIKAASSISASMGETKVEDNGRNEPPSTKSGSSIPKLSGIPKRNIPVLISSSRRPTSPPDAGLKDKGDTAESLKIGTDPRYLESSTAPPPHATITPTINSTVPSQIYSPDPTDDKKMQPARTGIPTRSSNKGFSSIPRSSIPIRPSLHADTLQKTRSSLRSPALTREEVKPFMRATSASAARITTNTGARNSGSFSRTGPLAYARRTVPGYR